MHGLIQDAYISTLLNGVFQVTALFNQCTCKLSLYIHSHKLGFAKIRVYNTSVFNSASTYQKVVGLIGHGASTLIRMLLSRSNNEQRFIFTLTTFKSFASEEATQQGSTPNLLTQYIQTVLSNLMDRILFALKL